MPHPAPSRWTLMKQLHRLGAPSTTRSPEFPAGFGTFLGTNDQTNCEQIRAVENVKKFPDRRSTGPFFFAGRMPGKCQLNKQQKALGAAVDLRKNRPGECVDQERAPASWDWEFFISVSPAGGSWRGPTFGALLRFEDRGPETASKSTQRCTIRGASKPPGPFLTAASGYRGEGR